MEATEQAACKHEYVRIYQRKLKGLERRLVATRAWLPVGFKQADFGHLSEGSYCFCTKCRARLFPKRTAAEKAQARLDRLAAAQNPQPEGTDDEEDILKAGAESLDEDSGDDEASEDKSPDENSSASISVDELDVVALDLDDLEESKSEADTDDSDEDI